MADPRPPKVSSPRVSSPSVSSPNAKSPNANSMLDDMLGGLGLSRSGGGSA